uniref:G-protein coupled receptors family 1 profile domain-containing protein n=1 Tax=Mastacembelus armatus TaxID=205130 RepID=A0A3Q3NBX5_9TELE
MSTTVGQSTLSTTINSTSNHSQRSIQHSTTLMVTYSMVLVTGTISLGLMMHILKSSSTSITSIAVFNLIFAHFIFLLTVPFRIYYYATEDWTLSFGWCKVVSSMIHIHMYMSFTFYVIILLMRLASFYHNGEQLASFQRIHAVLASFVLWIVVLVSVPCIIFFVYGKGGNTNHSTKTCFEFGYSIQNSVKILNYFISILIIVVATVLTALQTNVLRVLYRKHHQGITSQQDFGAQLKSLFFALIMVVCFIPYHMFRLYYLENTEELQGVNEVFLALTTFNCLDMLTFLGRRTCYMFFKLCLNTA